MISKNKKKYISSLQFKKYRDLNGVFIAEGSKIILDLLSSKLKCQLIIGTKEIIEKNIEIINAEEIIETTEDEIKKISSLKTYPQIIGLFYQQKNNIKEININNNLSIALDGIQDPGNMGTIIRTADWFGIKNIYCSHDTVDIYNLKTVQSSMGSLGRVNVFYTNLINLILETKIPVYGTFLEGKNVYKEKLSDNGIIIMGNEGKGISEELQKIITNKIHIPSYTKETPQSLNVSAATAIICSEFRRRQIEIR